MSKVSMGNSGFYGCMVEPQGVSTWLKERAQTREILVPYCVSCLEPQSSKTRLLLPIMPIDIVAYALTIFRVPNSRQSCFGKVNVYVQYKVWLTSKLLLTLT